MFSETGVSWHGDTHDQEDPARRVYHDHVVPSNRKTLTLETSAPRPEKDKLGARTCVEGDGAGGYVFAQPQRTLVQGCFYFCFFVLNVDKTRHRGRVLSVLAVNVPILEPSGACPLITIPVMWLQGVHKGLAGMPAPRSHVGFGVVFLC
ncbi:hypothetical protein CB1_000831011 [Camelus ferus]|nr:hypothetical protein CB1_000831011 [Camelus ferus]